MYKYTLHVIWIHLNIIYMSLVVVKPWFNLWYHVLYSCKINCKRPWLPNVSVSRHEVSSYYTYMGVNGLKCVLTNLELTQPHVWFKWKYEICSSSAGLDCKRWLWIWNRRGNRSLVLVDQQIFILKIPRVRWQKLTQWVKHNLHGKIVAVNCLVICGCELLWRTRGLLG